MEAHAFQDRLDVGFGRLFDRGGHPEVLLSGEVGVEIRGLEDRPDSLAALVHRLPAEPAEMPGRRVNDAQDHSERCRFPAAVGAQDPEDTALGDRQVEFVHRRERAEALGELPGFEHDGDAAERRGGSRQLCRSAHPRQTECGAGLGRAVERA